jgi:RHS repeat-associated protein
VNASGSIESQSEFDPYGVEVDTNSWDPNHCKFTGKERDAESGLDYFGARYYASTVGRWISPDWAQKPEAVPYSKMDDPQSLNLYEYVGNNPLSKADPDGHDPDPQAQTLALPLTAAAGEGAAEGSVAGPVGVLVGGGVALLVTAAIEDSPKLAPVPATGVTTVELKRRGKTGPKAADAETVTSNGQAASRRGEKLGPSGDEQGHSKRHNTKRGPREAAARNSKDGTARHDPNPEDGRGGHYHPNDTDNEGREHHYYPKNR